MIKEDKTSKKRIILLLVSVFIFIFLVFFGTKIYLIANTLIGNDLVVSSNIDNEDLFLKHNEEGSIEITTNTIVNPFCFVYCNYSLRDLKDDKIIELGNFTLSSIKPINNKFKLKAPSFGEGQELFRFNIKCKSQKSYLCNTDESMKSRTILITMNYNLTSEEELYKNSSKSYLEESVTFLDFIKINLINQENISSYIFKKENPFKENYIQLNNNVSDLNSTLFELIRIWKKGEYEELKKRIILFNDSLDTLNNSFYTTFSNLVPQASLYNYEISKLSEIRMRLTTLSYLNLSTSDIEKVNNLILEYNNLTLGFDNSSSADKNIIISNISEEVSSFFESLNETENYTSSFNEILSLNASQVKIDLIPSNLSISLGDISKICCLFNNCDNCCNNSCSNNSSKYPVILVHGHSFNSDVSSEMSLHSFESMQESLENYGFLNAGSVFITYKDINNGIWGMTNYPLSLTASYYFETVKGSSGETLLESKKDSIDTYSFRLNDIIKQVKQKTGRDKVIIVAHSMGGLVTRRYLQVFGEGDVDKVFLIDTPNKGISGKTLSYCPIFGSDLECSEMDNNSIFISKLNQAEKPTIPIRNIMGIGCNMDGEEGDGVVINSSSYLDFAENYYVNGTCDNLKFRYLHNEIIYPAKYPEVLRLLVDFLKNS